MKIKVGSKVKVVGVVESTDINLYERKKEHLGEEGFVYGTPHKFRSAERNGLPDRLNGKTIYSLENCYGKDISIYGWFAEELELLED